MLRSPRIVLGLLAGMSLGAYGYLLFAGPLRTHIPDFLVGFSVAAICYLAAIFFLRRTAVRVPVSGRFLLWSVILPALLFRVCMLASPPSLSDDIYRYVWDGRISIAGENPYRYAPDDPALAAWRDADVHPFINHPELKTIYPPVQQLLFALNAGIADTVFAFNLWALLAEMGCGLVLWVFLRRLGCHPANLLVWAWNPLVIVEFAGSGHHDSSGILLMLLSFGVLLGGRYGRAALLLAAAGLTKFLPLMLAPLLWGRRALTPVVIIAGCVIGCYLPIVWTGVDPFETFRVYVDIWRYNDFLFSLVYESVVWWGASLPLDVAKQIIMVLFAGFFAMLFHRRFQFAETPDPLLLAGLLSSAIGVMLLLSPTVHPWYLTWCLPFVVLSFRWSWIVATLTAPFAYMILIRYVATGVWEDTLAVKTTLFLPVCLLYVREWIRNQPESPCIRSYPQQEH